MSIEAPHNHDNDTNSLPKVSQDVSASELHDMLNPDRKPSWSEKHLTSRGKKFGALIAGTAVLLGGGASVEYAISHATSQEQPGTTNNQDPLATNTPAATETATSPATSPANTTPLETAPVTTQPEALELKKDMTNEEAAKTVVGILSEWGMAGANEDLYKEMMTVEHMTQYGQTRAERERFAADVAARSDDTYIKKLLGDNYDQSNPANIKLIHDLKQDHVTNLYNFIVSAPAYYSNVKPGDPPVELSGYQPWNQKLEYLKVESATDNNGVTTLTIDAADTDNRDKNDVGSVYQGATSHNLLITTTFKDSDKSHVSDITIVAH